MAQINSGIRKVLGVPFVYNLMQDIMGAKKFRKWFASNYINCNGVLEVLDIGCGTAEILDYFDENISYTGFDLSSNYIKSAKKKYGVRGVFECGVVSEKTFKEGRLFDVILVLGVLHHLDDKEVSALCQLASKHLRSGGKLITVDPCFIRNQNIIARYLISNDRGQNVRDQNGYLELLTSSFSSVDSNIRNQVWIPYTHCINVCVK